MRKMKQRKKSKNRTGKICISCMVVVFDTDRVHADRTFISG